MLRGRKTKSLTLFALFLFLGIFLLSGCDFENTGDAVKSNLGKFNDKLGEEFNDFNKKQQEASINFDSNKDHKKQKEERNLTEEQKRKVDAWLEEKGLNKYGDTKGVIYENGTPLYNKETGESIERYEYILNRYPNILEKIE